MSKMNSLISKLRALWLCIATLLVFSVVTDVNAASLDSILHTAFINIELSAGNDEDMSDYHDKLVGWFGVMVTVGGIIIAVIVTVGGVFAPLVINNNYKKHFEKTEADIKNDVNELLNKRLQEIKRYKEDARILKLQHEAFELRSEHSKSAYKKQLKLYNQIIEAQNDVAKHYLNRGQVNQHLYDKTSKLEYLEASGCDYDRSIELAPSDDETYYNRCVYHDKKGDYERALEDNKKAIVRDDSKKIYYIQKGELLAKLRRYDAAIEEFNKAGQKFGFSQEDDLAYVKLYISCNKLVDAYRICRRVLKMYPFSIDFLYQRFLIELKFFRYKSAEECIKRILEIEPKNYIYLVDYARLLNEIERYEEALLYCEKAIAVNNEKYEAYSRQGVIHTRMSNFASAMESFNKARERNSQVADIYANIAGLNFKNNMLESAEVDYKKAIELDPSSADRHAGLARFYYHIGRIEKSKEEIQNALRIDSCNANAYMTHLWIMQKEQGSYSIDEYEKIASKLPEWEKHELYLDLAEIFSSYIEDFESAALYIEKAMKYCPYSKLVEESYKYAYYLYKLGNEKRALDILNEIEREYMNE